MVQDQGVGREIKRLREERAWSQAKLAVEAEMSVSGVSMIENGQRNLTTTTLAKLARAFGLEIPDLFPKAQAALPLEDAEQRGAAEPHDEEAVERIAGEQRARTFLQQWPAEDQRVQGFQKAAEILNGYATRWGQEADDIEDAGTLPYGRSIEMETMRNRLSEALEANGLIDYAGWVETREVAASPREYAACLKLVGAWLEMYNVVRRMEAIEHRIRSQVPEEARRGLEMFETEGAGRVRESQPAGEYPEAR